MALLSNKVFVQLNIYRVIFKDISHTIIHPWIHVWYCICTYILFYNFYGKYVGTYTIYTIQEDMATGIVLQQLSGVCVCVLHSGAFSSCASTGFINVDEFPTAALSWSVVVGCRLVGGIGSE